MKNRREPNNLSNCYSADALRLPVFKQLRNTHARKTSVFEVDDNG